jgi:hypothetical protein
MVPTAAFKEIARTQFSSSVIFSSHRFLTPPTRILIRVSGFL